jgi:hypothetical protein
MLVLACGITSIKKINRGIDKAVRNGCCTVFSRQISNDLSEKPSECLIGNRKKLEDWK